MPPSLSLLRFTDRAASAVAKSTVRAAALARTAAKNGVRKEAQYWTAGAYGGMLILSADGELKARHCLTELAAAGYVRTETMPVLDAQEVLAIARG